MQIFQVVETQLGFWGSLFTFEQEEGARRLLLRSF